MEEGYTPNAEITKAVNSLPGYLQPVVTLMATMVPPSEERKMREEGLEGAVSGYQYAAHGEYSCSLNLHQVTVDCLSNDLFLFLFKAL